MQEEEHTSKSCVFKQDNHAVKALHVVYFPKWHIILW